MDDDDCSQEERGVWSKKHTKLTNRQMDRRLGQTNLCESRELINPKEMSSIQSFKAEFDC